MQVAIIIFDNFSMINFAKIHKILHKSGKFDIKICAYKAEICDNFGVFVVPQMHSQSLYGFDVVIFVDGNGQNLAHDEIYLSWLRSAYDARYKICLGSSNVLFEAAKFDEFIHFDELNEAKFEEIFKSHL